MDAVGPPPCPWHLRNDHWRTPQLFKYHLQDHLEEDLATLVEFCARSNLLEGEVIYILSVRQKDYERVRWRSDGIRY